MRRNLKKIVFSGGPGVGKTTILNEIKKLGYTVRNEVFTEIFSKANQEDRFDDLFENKKKLISDLIFLQLEKEKIDFRPKMNLLFLDRGMHDILGFSEQIENKIDAKELFLIKNQNYDLCVMPEPLKSEFYEQNLVRRQDYQESLDHHRKCIDFYKSYFKSKNMNPENHMIFIPDGNIEFRVQFALKYIFNFIRKIKQYKI